MINIQLGHHLKSKYKSEASIKQHYTIRRQKENEDLSPFFSYIS